MNSRSPLFFHVPCETQRAQFTLDEKATYNQVRKQIFNFERASKSWNQETVLKSIRNANKGVADGPTPMEVDRVEGKSTGMGKKGRGKGGWNIPWGAGRGFPVDSGTTAGTSLRNCQGGKFKTRGTSYTDLEMRDVECKSFFLVS